MALAICNAKAYITYHATEARGKKKTISSNEIFKGLEFAGFEDDLLDPLKEVLEGELSA